MCWDEAKSVSAVLVRPVVEVEVHGVAGYAGGTAVGAAGTAAGGTVGTAVGAAGATAAAAAAEVAAAGAAFAVGAAIGQGIHWLIHWGWDPINPLHPFSGKATFTSVHDLEIDNLLMLPPIGMPPWPPMINLDASFPRLGTALSNFLHLGIKTMVDAAQGVAAGTTKDVTELKTAAAALGSDLKSYAVAASELADAIDRYPQLRSALPKAFVTLAELRNFISLSQTGGLGPVINQEGAIIQNVFTLARVRSEVDIRKEIASWLALGISPTEQAAFQGAKFEALSFTDIFRLHAKCILGVNLAESPLLQGL